MPGYWGIPGGFVCKFAEREAGSCSKCSRRKILVFCRLDERLQQGIMIVANIFFTNYSLTGHRTRYAGCRSQSKNQKGLCAVPMIHSAMAASKSILSPMRCLTSLSHALGLVP